MLRRRICCLAGAKCEARNSRGCSVIESRYWLAQRRVDLGGAAIKAMRDRSRNRCRQDSVLGWIAYSKQDMNEAVLNLANATARCPANTGRQSLPFIPARKVRHTASRSAFEYALQSDPENAGLLNNMALTWLEAGDAAAARVILQGRSFLRQITLPFERIIISRCRCSERLRSEPGLNLMSNGRTGF